MSGQRDFRTIVTVLLTLAAYNWLLAILAGLLYVLDALSGTVWVGLYAAAGSFFWVVSELFDYHG